MVRQLWWRDLVRVHLGRLATSAIVGWVLGAVIGNQSAALTLGALFPVMLACWSWIRLTVAMRRRLPLGQRVSVTVSGDRLLIADTDQVWLGRGSATSVERIGAATAIFGRTFSVIVPTAVLQEDQATFLVGYGALPADVPHVPEPMRGPGVVVTEPLLAQLVAARRRSYLRSGEFGVIVVGAALVAGLALYLVAITASLVALALLLLPALFALAVMRSLANGETALRQAHPVGSTLAVHVDDDGLQVSRAMETIHTDWPDWQGLRVEPQTVELRTRPGRPLANLTLPRSLFSADDLALVRRHVPRQF